MDFRRRWGIKRDGNSHRMRNAHRKTDFERPDLENVASDLICLPPVRTALSG
jgi:hypothetical protein